MTGHKEIALVLDTRSKAHFNEHSIEKSVNFAPEDFGQAAFINWKTEVSKIEKDSSHFGDAKKQKAFQTRRRKWVFIIIAQHTSSVKKMLMRLHEFGNKDSLAKLVGELSTEEEKLDFLTIRNGLMLYTALKNERCREMDVCFEGFDHFKKHYIHHINDKDMQPCIPRP